MFKSSLACSATLVATRHHIWPFAQHQKSARVDSCKRPIWTMKLENARCPRATSRQIASYRTLFMIQPNTPIKPRLLVLDEDRIILQSLGQFLRREGYEVRTTDNPEDALGILESAQIE